MLQYHFALKSPLKMFRDVFFSAGCKVLTEYIFCCVIYIVSCCIYLYYCCFYEYWPKYWSDNSIANWCPFIQSLTCFIKCGWNNSIVVVVILFSRISDCFSGLSSDPSWSYSSAFIDSKCNVVGFHLHILYYMYPIILLSATRWRRQ